jgi:hypothetical protein
LFQRIRWRLTALEEVQGESAIIAVEEGDETLKLRDKNGFPMWSGGRRL